MFTAFDLLTHAKDIFAAFDGSLSQADKLQ